MQYVPKSMYWLVTTVKFISRIYHLYWKLQPKWDISTNKSNSSVGLEEAHKIEIVSVNVQDIVIWWL